MQRADLIAISSAEQVANDQPADLAGPLERGLISWEAFIELHQLVADPAVGRRDDRQITLHKNNGLAVQFAAVGAAVLDEAERRGFTDGGIPAR